VEAQRRPADAVHQLLPPRADLLSARLPLLFRKLQRRCCLLITTPCFDSLPFFFVPPLGDRALPPQLHELEQHVAEPRARAPEVPLIDPTPAVHETFREDALGGEIRHVLQGLVDDVHEDLEQDDGADDRIGGRGSQGRGAPGPEREEAEEPEGVAGFGEEGGQGEERGFR